MSQTVLENSFTQGVNIESRISQAAALIPPVWPLKTAIACNPLLHLEDLNFWDAVETSQRYTGQIVNRNRTEFVNRHLIKWLQSYLDEGVATLRMPGRQHGFYQAWKELAPFDEDLIETKEEEKILSSLPKSATRAVEFALDYLKIPDSQIDPFLSMEMSQLPGWAGYFRWRGEWERGDRSQSFSLSEFLAVRLGIYLIASQKRYLDEKGSFKIEKNKPIDRKSIEEKERNFAACFVNRIQEAAKHPKSQKRDAQWVFCIDVRSESFRRQLEQTGPYETFGFAGFFGLPIAIKDKQKGVYPTCPVLLQPKWQVEEKKSPAGLFKGFFGELKRFGMEAYQELKYRFGTPFALAETMGMYAGGWMALKSAAPSLSGKIKNVFLHSDSYLELIQEIPFESQVDLAESALRMMGLIDFAPLVIFCGHGSSCQNNPFASSLDCGACGGNRGGRNAALLASILNDPSVRASLRLRGIAIPETTRFIGAEHDTTTDEILFLTEPENDRLIDLKKHARAAGKANRAKRSLTFDAKIEQEKDPVRRSLDWAEVRPEWGLAKNGAFLIGPRAISESLDLKGRSFLHSYDWTLDPDGRYLETILTAPMVVAEWINTQYFFSALNQKLYGSGSKTTQNVVGKIGVMQGNGSDLMHGLPLQSVFLSDREPYHETIRLLTVVFAPISLIDPIVSKQPILQKLFFNEWVNLVAIDPSSLLAFKLNRLGKWEPFHQA